MPCACASDRCAGKLSGPARWNRGLEEGPDVSAFTRPRDFDAGGDSKFPAAGGVSHGVLAPGRFVEIGGDEPASVVMQDRVDTQRAASREMIVDDVVGNRQKRLVRTIRALDPGFLADAGDPLVCAGGAIPRSSGLRLPSERIGVLATAE